MDYFDKVKKILNFQHLGKRRLNQIEKEETLDKNLSQAYDSCPNLVFLYLMKTRELNRKYAKETYIASVLEYPEKAEKTLNIIDQIYSDYSTECPNKICQQLPKLLKHLDSL